MSSDHRLDKKIDQQRILDQLSQLSGSELNSFLLKLFQDRASRITPGKLMAQYNNSRFVREADIDTISFKRFELECLELAKTQGFEPVLLSPLAPLGTCSAIGKVNQNNVVSAVRGIEVVSDITNVLALKVAQEHRSVKKSDEVLHYAASQRLVRAQDFGDPAYSAHFGLICLVSGGFDQGSFRFETDQLLRHIHFHHELISKKFEQTKLYTKLMLKETDHPFNNFLRKRIESTNFKVPTEIVPEDDPSKYYQLIQFKTFVKLGEDDINVADGGVVDWTQKLTANKKHRLFISASGLELIYKFSTQK